MAGVIVIGAGAAGLAAVCELQDRGVEAVVLEARDRVGGRAFTSYGLAPHPVELGAEFIHGENVATWRWINAFAAPTIDDANHPAFTAYADGQLHGRQTLAARPNARAVWGAELRAREDVLAGQPDEAIAAGLARWTDFWPQPPSDDDLSLLRNAFAELHAADIEDVGAHSLLEATYEGDGAFRYFRLAEGYSALLSRVAGGLDVRLATPVERVAWGRDGVVAEAGGSRFEAAQAIITLPLGVLQAGGVTFDPPLPEAKQAAIAGLGAGNIGKIVLRFRERFWDEDFSFLLTPLPTQLWWRPGEGQPGEVPVLTAFFGGRDATRFGAMPQEQAASLALRDLETMFGRKLGHLLEASQALVWGSEPYTKMGYSSVPPGGVGRRDALAAPVDGVLFFAGEATNRLRPATVHGAIESGVRAATEVMGAR